MEKCDKHPKYKGLRRPKTCEVCHAIYEANKKAGIKEKRVFKNKETEKDTKVVSTPKNKSHFVDSKKNNEEEPVLVAPVLNVGPSTDPTSCEDYYDDPDEEQDDHDEPEDFQDSEEWEDDVPDEDQEEDDDDLTELI